MMPKVSPNSSLKNGPTTPCGSVWRMSPIFLRTSYQRSGTCSGGVEPLRLTKMRVTPALVTLRRKSTFSTSCSLRSRRSVTCSTVSSRVAPGQFACTTIVRKVNGGSSLRPRVV